MSPTDPPRCRATAPKRQQTNRTPLQQEASWVGECIAAKDFAAVVLLRSHLLQDTLTTQHKPSSQKQERALRALLHKAKGIAAATSQVYTGQLPQPSASSLLLRDASLASLQDQLLQLCATQRPGVDVFHRAEQLTTSIKQWLQAAAAPQAAVTVLFVSGDIIARVEHLIRSAGRPQFWSPAVMGLLLVLLHLYSVLMERAAHPAAAAVLAKLLLRPVFLDLLSSALELVNFSRAYQAQCQRPDWLGASLQVWDFLMRLLRFGEAHQAAVGPDVIALCQERVWGLLAPAGGLVVRVLEIPLGEETIAVQLQVLRFLRIIFNMAGSQAEQHQAALADHYVQYHFLECVKHYQASHADPKSATAELCGVHLRNLASLAGLPGAAVRRRFHQLRVLDFLLREFALESELLTAEAEEAPREDMDHPAGHGLLAHRPFTSFRSVAFSSDVGGTSGSSFDSPRNLSTATSRRSTGLVPPPPPAGTASNRFEFTYDLNEDFERLCAMEDELGCSVEFDAFERLGLESSRSFRSTAASSRGCGGFGMRSGSGVESEMAAMLTSASASSVSALLRGGSFKARPILKGGSFRRERPLSAHNLQLSSSTGMTAPPGVEMATVAAGVSAADGVMTGSFRSSPALKPVVIPKLMFSHISKGVLGSPSSGPTTAVGPHAAAARAAALREASTAVTEATGLAIFSAVEQSSSPMHSAESTDSGSPDTVMSAPSTPPATAQSPTPGLHSGGAGPSGTVPSRLGLSSAVPPVAPAVSIPDQLMASAARHLDARQSYRSVASMGSIRNSAVSMSRVLVHFQEGGDSDEGEPEGRVAGSSQSMLAVGSGGRNMPSLQLRSGLGSGAGSSSSSSSSPSGAVAALVMATAGSEGAAAMQRVPALNFSNLRKATDTSSPLAGGSLSTAFNSLVRSAHVPDSAMDSPPSPPAGASSAGVSGVANACGQDASVTAEGEQLTYAQLAELKLFYHDASLHGDALGLVMDLLLTVAGGLDATYLTQFPLDNGLLNAEHILAWHLNAPRVAAVVPKLLARHGGRGAPAAAAIARQDVQPVARLLRLLSRQLFDASVFVNLTFQTRGAYGGIYRAKMRASGGSPPQQVVIKTIELPTSAFERCVLPDVFGEVSILERYAGVAGFCQLIDYGVSGDAYWLVMKRYRCSLYEWRARQKVGCASATTAALYLNVLLQIVAAMQVLAKDNVVHFDIKCSNILVDPLPGTSDGELWRPASANPPFHVVLADFGEARAYRSASEAYTARIRGTEVYKSPEMLMLNNNRNAGGSTGGRGSARSRGVGLASDVWSLGCVTFELLAGCVLFGGDYATVTHRVAFGVGPTLSLTPTERSKLEDMPELVSLVEYILVRDPQQRPGLDAVARRIADVQAKLLARGTAPTAAETANSAVAAAGSSLAVASTDAGIATAATVPALASAAVCIGAPLATPPATGLTAGGQSQSADATPRTSRAAVGGMVAAEGQPVGLQPATAVTEQEVARVSNSQLSRDNMACGRQATFAPSVEVA